MRGKRAMLVVMAVLGQPARYTEVEQGLMWKLKRLFFNFYYRTFTGLSWCMHCGDSWGWKKEHYIPVIGNCYNKW